MAAEPQTGRREVSALTDARKTLAYDFFRILRAPQTEAELDQEVLKLFYPNQETQDTIERSEAGTDVFMASGSDDLFKKLKL
ncbi:hypothetical protein M2D44_28080 [Klebsiella pneumoniae]|nr:hypothetical protein [Klebsiella pneumoniae]